MLHHSDLNCKWSAYLVFVVLINTHNLVVAPLVCKLYDFIISVQDVMTSHSIYVQLYSTSYLAALQFTYLSVYSLNVCKRFSLRH